jgi:hypothetical protein
VPDTTDSIAPRWLIMGSEWLAGSP